MRQKNKNNLLSSLLKMGFLLMMLSLCMTVVIAQQATISGTVLDEFGEGVIGVNVVEKGTFNGTTTNVNGGYTITVSNAQSAVLQFSFVGYNTKDELVAGRTAIDVTLTPSVMNLDEVVVIGYGTQTRREITGSVTSLSQESFRKGFTRTAADLLQGKVAGLAIVSGSGAVGSNPAIRLRGVSTLQNDQGPFIVIDGVPGGNLNSVAPEDIESISVLKDASAAAIYGSRSASGVILITTKRGQASKTSISYSGYVAVSKLANKPDLMSADQWRDYAKANNRDMTPYDKYGANTDWFEEISRTAISQNHNLSLSGGTAKSNYRASYNYLNAPGVIRDDAMERHSFRFQFQQRAINDRLRFSFTGSGTLTYRDEHRGGNFVLAANMLPVYPVKLADGSWFDIKEYDQGNPVRNQTYNTNNYIENHFYANGELAFTIIDGLDIKTNLYKSRQMRDRNEYNSSETQAGRDANGWARRANNVWDKDMMDWLLEYRKTLSGGHKINALAGYSWEEENNRYFRADNRNFVTNVTGSNSLQSGQGLAAGDVNSNRNMTRLIGFFGRINYSFEERYMFTATVRRDGSSKFGANNKWGTFPSIGVAWGITQEKFMQGAATWIDDLKLRAGYGVTGNQSGFGAYTSLERYGTTGTYYDEGAWKTAYRIDRNPNPDLKWETTAMLNIGLDFGLFNGRLNGTVEWYNKKTSDMLYTYPVSTPPFMYNEMFANVGDMKNTGIELALNWNVVHTRDFNWTTTITADHNKNEIVSLSKNAYTADRVYTGDSWVRGGSGNTSHILEAGHPVGTFYGWKFIKFSDAGHYVMQHAEGSDTTKPVTDKDKTYIGDSNPTLTYGWTNMFNYKNFDLMFFFRGTIGNKVFNHYRMQFAQSGFLIGANALNDPLLYELKEVPKYCSLYIEDASHLRLDNLVLGYTFNVKNLNWLDNFRVYFSGQNVFVIHNVKAPDPEVDITRNEGRAPGVIDREFYPKSRTFSVGVNLVF